MDCPAGRFPGGDIQRTAELVSKISAVYREQSVGIEQIDQAIQQLDQMTQSNAGAANEMSATAGRLSVEAHRLEESDAFFKLGHAPSQPRMVSASREDSVKALQAKVQAFDATQGGKSMTRKFERAVSVAAADSGFHMDLGGSDGRSGGFEKMSA